MDERNLLDPLRWRQLRGESELPRLLDCLTRHPSRVARVRRADVLNRLGRQADAEGLLLSVPREDRTPLEWGWLALIMLDRLENLPPAERMDLYTRVSALPEDLPEGEGFAEGQYMLDLARGQALGEIGQVERARELLVAASRAARFLGLPDTPVRSALERLEAHPLKRLALHRHRLRQAVLAHNEPLTQAVADDLAMLAADLHDYEALSEALEHMRPGPRRCALRDAKYALLGNRAAAVPNVEATASGLPRIAAYLLAAERALLLEMGLREEDAAREAAEVLRQPPVITREHDLSREGVRLIDARLLLLAGDVATAAATLAEVTDPLLAFHAHLGRAEIDLRLGQHVQASLALEQAVRALEGLPVRVRRWAGHAARRLTTNAAYLLRELYRVPEVAQIELVVTLRHARAAVVEDHRAWLESSPDQVVAFRWLVAPLLPRD